MFLSTLGLHPGYFLNYLSVIGRIRLRRTGLYARSAPSLRCLKSPPAAGRSLGPSGDDPLRGHDDRHVGHDAVRVLVLLVLTVVDIADHDDDNDNGNGSSRRRGS